MAKQLEPEMEVIAHLKYQTQEIPMTNTDLLGKWRVIKSEIPNYSIHEEFLEFTANGDFIWILDGHILTYPYNFSDNKINYKTKTSIITIKIDRDKDLVILEPNHGNRSWIARY